MGKKKVTKLTKSELGKINALNKEKMELNERFIKLGWAEVDLELGKKRASEKAIEVSETEALLNAELIKKYGEIKILNLDTGEIELNDQPGSDFTQV